MRARVSSRASVLVIVGLVLVAVLAAIFGSLATAAGGGSSTGPDSLLSDLTLPLVRALFNIAALTTVGMCLVPFLLGDAQPAHVRPIMILARRATAIAALAWLSAALAMLVVQAAELNPSDGLDADLVAGYVVNVSAGSALLLSSVSAVLCVALSLLALHYGDSFPDAPRIFIAVLGLLPIPLTGHATGAESGINLVSVELHVLAASLWAGGLLAVVLLVAPHRGLLAHALPRFSTLATAAILTVGISGTFNGVAELMRTPTTGIEGLVTTGYGNIVLAKVACLVILAVLGAHVRFRLLPLILRHQRTALVVWVTVEIAVTGVAYGLGTVLARSPVL